MSTASSNQHFRNSNYTTEHVLEGYIDLLKNRYSIHINIHDIAGISSILPGLGHVLAPYLYHNNAFCNYLKKQDKTFEKCVWNKARLCSLCRKRKKPFYGRCYMGVEELIYPVILEGRLIAVICAGLFFSKLPRSLKRISERAETFDVNPAECRERFLNTACKSEERSMNPLIFELGILAECLAQIYRNAVLEMGKLPAWEGSAGNLIQTHTNSFIVQNTINFIRENFQKDLSLQVLASNSYCNPSYLSHIFKEKMSVRVVDYINQVRVEAAKQLLDLTAKSVTAISQDVGYNDSGYFARVFRQFTGMSPKEYRERKT